MVPQQRDQQRLRDRDPRNGTGTKADAPNCGSGDHRNPFMPPRRRRNGRGQEAVVQQRPSASCQGGPGIVKDMPTLRECERALTLERRWRAPRGEAGITGPQMRQSTRVTSSFPQADAAMGEVRRRVSHRGLWLHARVIPAAFPSGKTGHISGAVNVNLEWTWISDDRRPQMWKRGSLKTDRSDQPEEPDHAIGQWPEWRRPGEG